MSSLCTSLTLLFLKSNSCQHNTIFNLMQDHDCILSTGAYCAYLAMGLWFVASSFLLLREEEKRSDVIGNEGGDGDVRNSENEVMDDARVPLIQDVILECKQSTYSSSYGYQEEETRSSEGS